MDRKLEELLQVARSKTDGGELKWRAFTDESFRTAIGSGYLHVSRGMTQIEEDGDRHPARTYSARVTDEQGRVVAEVDATVGFLDGPVSLLGDLFEAARKSALQSEGVIEKMLGALRGR